MKVSVIVPVYNTEKYLRRCLDSLVNQTLNELEIIVIEDNSPDNSNVILKEYEDKYKDKIRVFHNKTNKGIGYNRNKGIKEASGEYLGFVDSDDFVDETMYEKLYNKAEKDKLDLVVCNFKRVVSIKDDYKELDNEDNIKNFKSTSLKNNPSLLLDINLGPCNKLYKKDLLNDNLFPENLKYEDAIVVAKAILNAKRIGNLTDELYYYVIRQKSETTSMDKRVFDVLEINKMIVDNARKIKDYKLIENELEALVIRTLFRYTIQQKYQEDKKLASKFIDEVFNYLDNEFPNWRKNKIFNKRNILKKLIEKHRYLTKIYIKL